VKLCFSSGGRAFSTESGFERINKAPTPVHASSLYRATRQG
jgi:hypothetical protein